MGVWEESNSFWGWGQLNTEDGSEAENVGEGWSAILERQ